MELGKQFSYPVTRQKWNGTKSPEERVAVRGSHIQRYSLPRNNHNQLPNQNGKHRLRQVSVTDILVVPQEIQGFGYRREEMSRTRFKVQNSSRSPVLRATAYLLALENVDELKLLLEGRQQFQLLVERINKQHETR